jgi:citrate lyase beta subunit
MLRLITAMDGADRLDGFVVPKATADSLPAYLDALVCDHHLLMPTVESLAAFEPAEMRRLRGRLLADRARILAVRIGGNDLLQLIGARRSTTRTAYEGPLGAVIANLVAAFAPFGFALSAPVLESFADPGLLREEVERDIEHGLVTKTAIHPAQLKIIQDVYAVHPQDLACARAVLSSQAQAVFASGGVMSEPATHARWAQALVRRAEAFGLSEPERPVRRAAGRA